MEKDKMEKSDKQAQNVYAPPCIEVHTADPSVLLAGTTIFGGGAGEGNLDEVNGAKKQNLNVEFRDVWEE